MMKKVVIILPNNHVARHLAVRLLETGSYVTVYCPSDEDIKICENILEELMIVSHGLANRSKSLNHSSTLENSIGGNRFAMQTGEDFSDADVLVIPNMDVKPDATDEEYILMLEGQFQEMKANGLMVNHNTKIVFGANVGGLMAGDVWAKLWPAQKDRIYVASSLYKASVLVFGENSDSRALQKHRRSKPFFSDQVDSKIENMGNLQSVNDFCTLETKELHQLVSLLLREADTPDFTNFGVIGKFPSKEECEIYKVEENKMGWVPTVSLSWFPRFLGLEEVMSEEASD